MTEQDDLSRGFDAGNYANAYTSDCLASSWLVQEDGVDDDSDLPLPKPYRAAFVIGFFATYEYAEIPEEHREEHEAALTKYGAAMRAQGIAVRDDAADALETAQDILADADAGKVPEANDAVRLAELVVRALSKEGAK